ncbi:enkurin-like [Convolutriloba macropyga]|uniref:enkurin-like n=1 Tax=Convolutriloba macropyga TaxID=536237 RepID=UPI003F527138
MVIKKVMTSSGLAPYDTKRPTICRGEENILNLIPINRILPPIPKRYTGYVSCFHPQAVIERRKNRHCRRTMGWALEPLKDPNCFLKKNCGIKQPSHCVTKYKHEPRLPPIPKDPPLMNLRRDTDFIRQNAAENILLKGCPNQIRRGIVDDRNGHFEPLINSGLERKYIYKPNYGKTPKYILRRYRQQFDTQQAEDRYNGEFLVRGTSKLLCDDEKEALIWGLKHNWEAVNKEYICGLKASDSTVQQR